MFTLPKPVTSGLAGGTRPARQARCAPAAASLPSFSRSHYPSPAIHPRALKLSGARPSSLPGLSAPCRSACTRAVAPPEAPTEDVGSGSRGAATAVAPPRGPGDMTPAQWIEVLQTMRKDYTKRMMAARLEAALEKRVRTDPEYDSLKGEYDVEKLQAFYKGRPLEVLERLVTFTVTSLRIANKWQEEERKGTPEAERTRGALLRDLISELGPVSVKMGQTMSQRADIVGQEAASALSSLTDDNTPFPDAVAMRTIAEDLKWTGPIAPGICPKGNDPEGKPLFKALGASPIAAASLGQVYQGTTWEGVDVAVKVQRPGLIRQVSLDMYCLRLFLMALRAFWGGGTVDLRPIADEVGGGVFVEMDYMIEANNADEFRRRHAFLGFVTTPKWLPDMSTSRVLTMEFVKGRKVSQLGTEESLSMVQMAVECSVAQLLQTGLVHADPHEGNLIFTDDGQLCYLDFGLVTDVEPRHMEAFANGIVHLLSGDFRSLAVDFQNMDFVPPDFGRMNEETREWEPCTIEDFCVAIEDHMKSTFEDGVTEFGDLVIWLGGLSSKYKFLCPPYLILLCRAFLTLEGIAAKIDSEFNIYEASFPYAMRRGLAPTTADGKAALRASLLTAEGELRWAHLKDTLEAASASKGDKPSEVREKEVKNASAGNAAAVLGGLLGAPEGVHLRSVLRDMNSTGIARLFLSKDGRSVRRLARKAIGGGLLEKWQSPKGAEAATAATMSPRQRREQGRQKRFLAALVGMHLRRLVMSGPLGILSLAGMAVKGAGLVAGAFADAVAGLGWWWCVKVTKKCTVMWDAPKGDAEGAAVDAGMGGGGNPPPEVGGGGGSATPALS